MLIYLLLAGLGLATLGSEKKSSTPKPYSPPGTSPEPQPGVGADLAARAALDPQNGWWQYYAEPQQAVPAPGMPMFIETEFITQLPAVVVPALDESVARYAYASLPHGQWILVRYLRVQGQLTQRSPIGAINK